MSIVQSREEMAVSWAKQWVAGPKIMLAEPIVEMAIIVSDSIDKHNIPIAKELNIKKI